MVMQYPTKNVRNLQSITAASAGFFLANRERWRDVREAAIELVSSLCRREASDQIQQLVDLALTPLVIAIQPRARRHPRNETRDSATGVECGHEIRGRSRPCETRAGPARRSAAWSRPEEGRRGGIGRRLQTLPESVLPSAVRSAGSPSPGSSFACMVKKQEHIAGWRAVMCAMPCL